MYKKVRRVKNEFRKKSTNLTKPMENLKFPNILMLLDIFSKYYFGITHLFFKLVNVFFQAKSNLITIPRHLYILN